MFIYFPASCTAHSGHEVLGTWPQQLPGEQRALQPRPECAEAAFQLAPPHTLTPPQHRWAADNQTIDELLEGVPNHEEKSIADDLTEPWEAVVLEPT